MCPWLKIGVSHCRVLCISELSRRINLLLLLLLLLRSRRTKARNPKAAHFLLQPVGKTCMSIRVHPIHWIVQHIGVQVERLWIIEFGVWHRFFLRAPVRAHEAAEAGGIVPCLEVIVARFGVVFLSSVVLLGSVDALGQGCWRVAAEPIPIRQAAVAAFAGERSVDLDALCPQPVGKVEVGSGRVVGGQQFARSEDVRVCPGGSRAGDGEFANLLAAGAERPTLVDGEAVAGEVACGGGQPSLGHADAPLLQQPEIYHQSRRNSLPTIKPKTRTIK